MSQNQTVGGSKQLFYSFRPASRHLKKCKWSSMPWSRRHVDGWQIQGVSNKRDSFISTVNQSKESFRAGRYGLFSPNFTVSHCRRFKPSVIVATKIKTLKVLTPSKTKQTILKLQNLQRNWVSSHCRNISTSPSKDYTYYWTWTQVKKIILI